MYRMLLIICVLLFAFSCQNAVEQKPSEETIIDKNEIRKKRNLAKKDSIMRAKIALKQAHKRQDSIDIALYSNAPNEEILQFLRTHSKFRGTNFCTIAQNHIVLNYAQIENLVTLPKPIYDRILPKIKPNEGDKKEVTEWRECKIKEATWLYGLNEKEKYIQLLIATSGKYSPIVTLFTLSKPNLKLIEEMIIHSSFADVGEVDITLSCLKENSEEFTLWEIHNSTTKSNWELVDTLEVKYEVLENGRIKKLSEKLL